MSETNVFALYPDCVNDRHKLRGILLDFFPGERLQSNLIMSAFDAGIVTMIKKATKLDENLQKKIWGILIEDFGIAESNASWAVEYWMSNYGSFILRKPLDFVDLPKVDSSGKTSNSSAAVSKEVLGVKAESEITQTELKNARVEVDFLKTELQKTKAELEQVKNDLQSAWAETAVAKQTMENTAGTGVVQICESRIEKNPAGFAPEKNATPKPQIQFEGSIAIFDMREDEKLPKERILLFSDEYEKFGITNFRATVIRGYENDGYTRLSINGEYDGKTSSSYIIVPMVFNENDDLIAVNFNEKIKAKIRSHKTYSTTLKAPNNENISRVEVRIIKDPIFLD